MSCRIIACTGCATQWQTGARNSFEVAWLNAQMPKIFNSQVFVVLGMPSLSQSMVMQKKLRKAVSYVARVQSFSFSGPASKGTMDCHLLKWFRSIPGVGSEVSVTITNYSLSCLGEQFDGEMRCSPFKRFRRPCLVHGASGARPCSTASCLEARAVRTQIRQQYDHSSFYRAA